MDMDTSGGSSSQEQAHNPFNTSSYSHAADEDTGMDKVGKRPRSGKSPLPCRISKRPNDTLACLPGKYDAKTSRVSSPIASPRKSAKKVRRTSEKEADCKGTVAIVERQIV
jgi:hypothetical protein